MRRPVLRAHVLHHRRLPPLLLAPQLPAQPVLAVRDGLRRRHRRPRRARCGGRRTTATTTATATPPSDVHSPTQKGFFWSHVGWILCDKYAATDYDRIKDFSKYPELVFLNKKDWIAPWLLGFACFLIGGWSGLLIGFFLSTVLLWHATFTVNSLAHVLGRRRYATEDTSRNSVLIAALTMGEGWHNNHHYYQASARQGFFWWEWDPTYYVLKVLSWLHVVRGLRTPPARVRAANRVAQGAFDIGMFRAHWGKATRAVARLARRPGRARRPGQRHRGPGLDPRCRAGRGGPGPGLAQGGARGLRALVARVGRGAGPGQPPGPARAGRRGLNRGRTASVGNGRAAVDDGDMSDLEAADPHASASPAAGRRCSRRSSPTASARFDWEDPWPTYDRMRDRGAGLAATTWASG